MHGSSPAQNASDIITAPPPLESTTTTAVSFFFWGGGVSFSYCCVFKRKAACLNIDDCQLFTLSIYLRRPSKLVWPLITSNRIPFTFDVLSRNPEGRQRSETMESIVLDNPFGNAQFRKFYSALWFPFQRCTGTQTLAVWTLHIRLGIEQQHASKP